MNSKYWDLDDHKPAQIVANIFSLLSRLTIFFSNPYKIERDFEFSGLACQWSPYSSYSFTRNLQRWIKVRSFVIPVYVNLLHSGAFVAYSGVTLVSYSGVTLVSFLFVAVSFQLVPVYSGTILVHSVSFPRHSGLLRYIPLPFLSIPFHSAVFRYILVYSVPFQSVPVFSNAEKDPCIPLSPQL